MECECGCHEVIIESQRNADVVSYSEYAEQHAMDLSSIKRTVSLLQDELNAEESESA